MFKISRAVAVFAGICLCLVVSSPAYSQAGPAQKTRFFDSDGRQISNNEFVDIRVANPHLPDHTIVRTFDDGSVEFRLQKVPQEGMRAPEFRVRVLDGGNISMADLKGKVVVLNFWFIGCKICLSMKPMLNEVRAKYAGRDDVVFLAMTADAEGDLRRFLADERFDYQQAGNAKAAMDQFAFTGYPKNIVISRAGEIVYWRGTIKAWDKFISVINTEIDKGTR